MKRFLTSFLSLAAAAIVFGQAPFTIVRPADGSKVRETVHILFPKDSVPPGGYIGIFLGGKFYQAVVPPTSGQYLDYSIDTKKAIGPDGPIPDGPLHIEAVLYVAFNDQPKIVDRSSITVDVGNHQNIEIPANGFKFNYHFVPNTEWVYHVNSRVTSEVLTASEARNGQSGSQQSSDESFRLLYAIDNAYPNGDGLVRMQMLPEKNEASAIVTLEGNPNPMRVFLNQMGPVYMRVNSHGLEKYGSAPEFMPSRFASPTIRNGTVVWPRMPLPILPSGTEKPGDPWTSQFGLPVGNINPDLNALTRQVPNRGEFVDVEWEMNHPCARIHNEIEAGEAGKDHTTLSEDLWFALDKKVIVKREQVATIERTVVKEPAGGTAANRNTGPAAPNGGNGGAGPRGSRMRNLGGGGGAPQNGGNSGSSEQMRGGGRMGGLGGGNNPPSAPPSNPTGRFTGGPQGPVTEVVRQTYTRTMYLEN